MNYKPFITTNTCDKNSKITLDKPTTVKITAFFFIPSQKKHFFFSLSNIFQPRRMNGSHCLVNSGFYLSFGNNSVSDVVAELFKALAFRCRHVILLYYAPQFGTTGCFFSTSNSCTMGKDKFSNSL